MCRIFAGQDPAMYGCETRSIRLNGHSTSVRLERKFWEILEEIAASEGITVARFVSKLHDEVTELRGEVSNFTSLLRCACLAYALSDERRAARPMGGQASTAAVLRAARESAPPPPRAKTA